MNLRFMKTEIFAFIILLFANLISANAQTDSNVYRVLAGTTIRVKMDNEINSKVASVNDTFTTTLTAPFMNSEIELLPAGTVIEGRITRVERASFKKKNGKLEFSFQTLRLPNGVKREIEGVLVDKPETKSSPSLDALLVIGATALGGVVGTASEIKNGALLGAGIGVSTGTGFALLRKGREVRIKADEEFEIKLTKTVNLPVRDF